jgi:hypothetical protein
MLKFESQDEIQVYAGQTGFICFKARSDIFEEPRIVMLTIGQFRKVIKNADELIANAELNKAEYELESNDETDS